jgi:phage-related tail protein
MDKYTEQRIEEFTEQYLNGNENILIRLNEINKDYQELFPIIKRVAEEIIRKENAGYKADQDEYLKDTLKESSLKTEELKEKLEKIKEIHNNLEKNKKELSDIINQK